MSKTNIYLGTVALEINRWSSRIPSFSVSGWLDKIRAAGFDGIELWENHVLLSENEAEKIKDSGFPVGVYNHYGIFTNSDTALRTKAADMIRFLDAGAVKYNIGNNPDLLAEYKENVLRFAESLPDNCVLLCECHAGTLLENDNAVEDFFKGLCPQKFAMIIHPFAEPETLRSKFERFGNRIAHIHSQYSYDNKRIRLERQPEQVAACFDILKEYGYNGSFTIEFSELTAEPGENIDDLFANTVLDLSYIRRNFT